MSEIFDLDEILLDGVTFTAEELEELGQLEDEIEELNDPEEEEKEEGEMVPETGTVTAAVPVTPAPVIPPTPPLTPIAKFMKDKTIDQETYTGYFSSVSAATPEEILKLREELKAIERSKTKKITELTLKESTMYSGAWVPKKVPNVIVYRGRNSTYFFDGSTGYGLENAVDADTYTMDTKEEVVSMVIGYAPDLGSIIVLRCDVKISSGNERARITQLKKVLVPIFPHGSVNFDVTEADPLGENPGVTARNLGSYGEAGGADASEFLSLMFGEKKDYGVNFNQLVCGLRNVPNAETILRTAKSNEIADLLDFARNTGNKNAGTIAKMFGLTEADRQKLSDKKELTSFLYFRKNVENRGEFFRLFPTKTDNDLLEFYYEIIEQKKVLDYYGISVGRWGTVSTSQSAEEIIKWFTEWGVGFHNYYSLMKFVRYICEETVNQGFSSLYAYVERLNDYIGICKRVRATPRLYTDSLAKTHDIMARNHSISISDEDITRFQDRYDGDKIVKIKDYLIIPPCGPAELQIEGDRLSHCVAFYIHKVIEGECKVFFLRTKAEPDEPYVTLEVRDGSLTQAKGLLNRDVTEEERAILEEYCDKMGLGKSF